MTQKVLVVEDTATLRRMVRLILEKNHYQVLEAYNGQIALEMIEHHTPDLVLLDINIPVLNGMDVCKWIRQHATRLPIIFLSVLSDEDQKVQAFHAGADDYITKPFGENEMLARIRAVLRRSTNTQSTDEFLKILSPIRIGELVIEQDPKRVLLCGIDMRFTPIEFDLLRILAFNTDNIVSHETLLERIWGQEYRNYNHYLHIYFNRIRKKLGIVYGSLIQTFPRAGYVLYSKLAVK